MTAANPLMVDFQWLVRDLLCFLLFFLSPVHLHGLVSVSTVGTKRTYLYPGLVEV